MNKFLTNWPMGKQYNALQ